ncbi:dTDP-4-dehydrorhamnose 3,5-epimerase [Flavobacterium sp. CYK-55]|uniref:dTDP-4-dehydrorhamnose 3,5-epimerase n=1 Tax=Flavobacterium sp. CYK-55 TaxID=2835529 RepID=UPI001BCDB8E2|nr:dTDP-4-dehydrorhamnose 3,5-epimerase [Flavobacterium sp. CYK-55]MBS7786170.1 dTDP-4-dehydrorhamnose 3,5-epimerase [Flavobacterium sp. CYK-55]
MKVTPTALNGCYIIEPKVFPDPRGYFFESFNERTFFETTGLQVHFVQDNQSFSSKGVLRGLHYQTGAHMQAKLVRVISGEVLDVAVDIRTDSPTYGQHVSVVLTAENHKQLFIPRGFAHGFLVLSQTATFFYKCDNFYNKESEGGIAYNDPSLFIDWILPESELILSEKDLLQPCFANAKKLW